MAFDFKKEYKALYLPPAKPQIVTVPLIRFAAVRGQGDPNQPDGSYQQALAVLYAVAYTLKMSKMTDHRIDGFFDYVVPPLEGLWHQEGRDGIDCAHKELFRWVSMIRLPDFVTSDDFAWAKAEAARKKKIDTDAAELLAYDEGLCVQCLHLGSYDDEPETIRNMHAFAEESGYLPDYAGGRRHHEIYLSDPRKTAPEKLKTVIRIPVKQK